jgi:hypothetical protein
MWQVLNGCTPATVKGTIDGRQRMYHCRTTGTGKVVYGGDWRQYVWDYEKHSSQHDHMGFGESTVAKLVAKVKEGMIPIFMVMREKKK